MKPWIEKDTLLAAIVAPICGVGVRSFPRLWRRRACGKPAVYTTSLDFGDEIVSLCMKHGHEIAGAGFIVDVVIDSVTIAMFSKLAEREP